MLIRIVRMSFKQEKVNEFLAMFDEVKHKIRNQEGCSHLELQQYYYHKNIYSTYSIWENDKALNSYRNSELFKSVWGKTRSMFEEKPIAFSSRIVEKVDKS